MAGQDGTGPTEIPQLFEAPVRDWLCYCGTPSVAIINYLWVPFLTQVQPLFFPDDDHSLTGNSPLNDLSLSIDLRVSATLIAVLYWCVLTK